jgi:hypothetical protein
MRKLGIHRAASDVSQETAPEVGHTLLG